MTPKDIDSDVSGEEFADRIASLACKALLYEVAISPKPGLVDRFNNGAHTDMDMFTFIGSAAALTPYFRDMAREGLEFPGPIGTILPRLRPRGVRAEKEMFRETGGVNTHKGLVFSMGVFCVAAGHLRGRALPFTEENFLGVCAAVTAETPGELAGPPQTYAATHGQRVHARFGMTGIRGEAAAGYPNIRRHGLPVLRRALAEGNSFNDAGVATLLHLVAHVEDTNIVSRSDAETLKRVQAETRAFLESGPGMTAMLRFAARLDERFIQEHISPGGSADLLALTCFLHFILNPES